MSRTLSLYERFTRYPLGNTIFSKALCFRVPYCSTIHPLVTGLRSGHSQIEVDDRWSIRNHIGTVHAGALCTMSELTGGLAVDTALPPNLRFIPREMTIQYIKKATGTLKGKCSIDSSAAVAGDIKVPVEITDNSGDTVVKAVIVFYISEKKDKSRAA